MTLGHRALVPPLGLLAAWFGASLGLWLMWPAPPAPPPAPQVDVTPSGSAEPAPETMPLPPVFAAQSARDPAADAALFAERPLLSETRRVPLPPPPPAAAPDPAASPLAAPAAPRQPAAPPPTLRLQGLYAAEGKGRALLLNLEDGEAAWFAVGDEVMGWKLAKISQDSAFLTREGAEITIQLFEEALP